MCRRSKTKNYFIYQATGTSWCRFANPQGEHGEGNKGWEGGGWRGWRVNLLGENRKKGDSKSNEFSKKKQYSWRTSATLRTHIICRVHTENWKKGHFLPRLFLHHINCRKTDIKKLQVVVRKIFFNQVVRLKKTMIHNYYFILKKNIPSCFVVNNSHQQQSLFNS